MSRSSREITFRCAEGCKAFHARPYIEEILGIKRTRIYELIAAGELTAGVNGCISCQSARRYAFGADDSGHKNGASIVTKDDLC